MSGWLGAPKPPLEYALLYTPDNNHILMILTAVFSPINGDLLATNFIFPSCSNSTIN